MDPEFDEMRPPLSEVSIYEGPEVFLGGFARLSERQQVFFATGWLSSEVCNGGFHQFFTNATGVLAPEALAGFRRAGANALADIVERALLMLGEPYPRDQGEREQRLEDLVIELEDSMSEDEAVERRGEWDPFGILNEAFYAALRSDTAVASFLGPQPGK
jgi:hypothetical protein